MAPSKKKKPQFYRGWKKSRKVNAPISQIDLMVNELPLSLENIDMRKLSISTDPTNGNSTCVKRKIRILDHLKNLLEVLCASIVISQGLIGNNITTRPK